MDVFMISILTLVLLIILFIITNMISYSWKSDEKGLETIGGIRGDIQVSKL